ncbi:MAG: hypothetical protein QM749_16185 [Aquabacterium sp.]
MDMGAMPKRVGGDIAKCPIDIAQRDASRLPVPLEQIVIKSCFALRARQKERLARLPSVK